MIDAFKPYRQFITYTTRPKANGKLDKIPTDWRTGQAADAHNPGIWTDFASVANQTHGFVFTDKDPFWFLDIDNCLMPDNTWSPLAMELCTLLAGCAIEISISGKGLHLFGTGLVPPHGTRNSALGLEFYHKGRFVALGSGAQGDANKDCTAGIAEMVARYFPKQTAEITPDDWRTEPVAEWGGPKDDDELIRRACGAKSTAGIFGNRATFAQLWDADVAALKVAYPDPARDYDASSADMALAQHFAFWTGKNSARIERLMRQSKLARPKWDEHKTYIRDTVTHATSRQVDVCKGKPQVTPVADKLSVKMREGSGFLNIDEQLVFFEGCTYVGAKDAILCPDGILRDKGRFDRKFNGLNYAMDAINGKFKDSAWEAFTNSKAISFPQVEQTEFRPDLPPLVRWDDQGVTKVNSYFPMRVNCQEGNARPFLDHMGKLFPVDHDRTIMLSYMAACVQKVGVKFAWCPVIIGCEGNGKTTILEIMHRAIGQRHTHGVRPENVNEKFNTYLENKIFVSFDDVLSTRQDFAESIKAMVTSTTMEIRAMRQDQYEAKICCNFMVTTNHVDAIKITNDSRRFAAFITPHRNADDIFRDGMTASYFNKLRDWLELRDGYAIVTNYLKKFKILPEYDPTIELRRAPKTSSSVEVVKLSALPVEQEIRHAIDSEKIGFRGGYVSSHYLDLLLRDLRLDRDYPRNKRGRIMEGLGYLSIGRSNNAVQPDGVKVTLYINDPNLTTLGYTPAQLQP